MAMTIEYTTATGPTLEALDAQGQRLWRAWQARKALLSTTLEWSERRLRFEAHEESARMAYEAWVNAVAA
jgi:hypothetical protein